MATPHLVLIGYGVTDTLQITVEAQRLLARYGSAYSLGLPANLAAFLKSQRVKVADIASRMAPGRDYADSYLDIANFLIGRTAHERPGPLPFAGAPAGLQRHRPLPGDGGKAAGTRRGVRRSRRWT